MLTRTLLLGLVAALSGALLVGCKGGGDGDAVDKPLITNAPPPPPRPAGSVTLSPVGGGGGAPAASSASAPP